MLPPLSNAARGVVLTLRTPLSLLTSLEAVLTTPDNEKSFPPFRLGRQRHAPESRVTLLSLLTSERRRLNALDALELRGNGFESVSATLGPTDVN